MPKDNLPPRPNFDALRTVLGDYASKPAFLVWRSFEGTTEGKFSKIPVDPVTGLTTAPNTAKDRGVLTLTEAIAAARKLAESDLPVGIGMYPPHAGLIAGDLDGCLNVNGSRTVKDWAVPIIGDAYAEISPSGTGIRLLLSEVSDGIAKMANGQERHSLGFYGDRTAKFVTLTGNVIDSDAPMAIKPLSEASEAAVWAYLAKQDAEVGRPGMSAFSSMYPPGKAGMNQALDDIISGASLHPATVAYAARAINYMTAEDLHRNLEEAYQASDAKGTSRWQQRYPSSIFGALDWIATKDHGAGSGLREMPQQKIQGAMQFMKESIARKKAETVQKEALGGYTIDDAVVMYGSREWPQVIMPDEYAAIIKLFPDLSDGWHEGLDDDEIDAIRLEYFLQDPDAGDPPSHLRKQYNNALDAELRLAGIDAIKARVEAAKEKPDFELLESIPAGPMKDIADHCYQMLGRDMPEVAVMAALVGVSATMTGYCATSNAGKTPLMIWGQALAGSGTGKSYVETAIAQIIATADLSTATMPNSSEGFHRAMLTLKDAATAPKDGKGGTSAVMVILLDEIAYWMEKIKEDRAGTTGPVAAFGTMLSLYNRSIGALGFIPAAFRATKRDSRDKVVNPSVHLAGFSVAGSYMDSMTDRMLQGGWANRTLHFFSDYECAARSPRHKRPDGLPAHVVDILKAIPQGCAALTQKSRGGGWADASDGPHFYRAAEGHRFVRTVELTEDQLMTVRAYKDRLDVVLVDLEAPVVIANRFEENVFKIAAMCAVLDHAHSAAILGEWEQGQLMVSDKHLEWASWLMTRLVTTFGRRIAGMAGSSIDQNNAQKILAIAEQGIADPQLGKYRPQWVAALKAGLVPHSYLVRRAALDVTRFNAAMKVLEELETVHSVQADDPNIPADAKSQRGTTSLVYEILPD